MRAAHENHAHGSESGTRFASAVEVVGRTVASGELPSAVLAVQHGRGRPAAVVAFLTRPGGDTVERASIWFLASVTKPVLATAAMLLVEDGLLDLDEPVARHLPRLAGERRETITARQLLSHTSGIDDAATGTLTRSRPSAQRLLELAYILPLRFPPGARYEYSSVSFFVLGELIAQRSGMPYPAFLRERVLAPLGMDETTFDPRPLGGRRLVPVHGAALDSRWRKWIALRYLASINHPGGGLWGTLDDLLAFGNAMLDAWHGRPGAILRPESVREMTRLQTARAPAIVDGRERQVSYALGWGKPGHGGAVAASPDAFEHGGASGTRLWVDPAHDLMVVFLSNLWGVPPEVGCLPALREVYRVLEAS